MKQPRIAFARLAGVALLLALAGAEARGAGVSDIADQAAQKLLPAIRASDMLVEAGQETVLEASLGTGLRKEGLDGKRIQFFMGEQMLGEVRTDGAGTATFRWKVPEKPTDYRLQARLSPADQPQEKVADADIFVAARAKDATLVVVDLDRTVVQSGFFSVLVGAAKPMPGAAVVLGRLARDNTIVYLTHRPDFLATTSKRWLTENGFPPGPVLTSTMGTLLSGSGAYKAARLAAVKKTFPNVLVGIGDKMSDAKVYANTGARPILIFQADWSEHDPEKFEKLADELAALPDSVQVVTNWQQVAAVCFEKAVFLKRDMERRLRDTAAELRRKGKD
jgi:hypothetical protein